MNRALSFILSFVSIVAGSPAFAEIVYSKERPESSYELEARITGLSIVADNPKGSKSVLIYLDGKASESISFNGEHEAIGMSLVSAIGKMIKVSSRARVGDKGLKYRDVIVSLEN